MTAKPRWHRNGKQILRYGQPFADASSERTARIIRHALVALDIAPYALAAVVLLVATVWTLWP